MYQIETLNSVKFNVRENKIGKLNRELKRKKERYFDWDQMVTGDRKVEGGSVVLRFVPPWMMLLRLLLHVVVIVVVSSYRVGSLLGFSKLG